MISELYKDAINLLKELIKTPSISGEEKDTADIIENFLKEREITTYRELNNVWAFNKYYNPELPTILLNSHHDTVKPNSGYSNNPYEPVEKNEKLFGLGSNDAGGCLVSLIAAFIYFYESKNLQYNLIILASAEEETSGNNGVHLVYPGLKPIEFAIVGEPTQLQLAVAEKGLIVLDCEATGKAGHAAREEGINAIYKAMEDIQWFKNYKFEKESPSLGNVKMTITQINAGTQHNVVPDRCTFTVDIRVTDAYSNEEVIEIISSHIVSEPRPRSLRLRSSSINPDHPLVKQGISMGKQTYGSPTMSDQSFIDCPSLKMGPGDSARSHTPDEFIYIKEIEQGIEDYIHLLKPLLKI